MYQLKKIIVMNTVFLLLLTVTPVHSHMSNCSPIDISKSRTSLLSGLGVAQVPHPEIDMQQVIKLFLNSVDDGELVLFDSVISREDIKPLRVEYIYDLETELVTVKVYSHLETIMYLPTAPDFRINGISAILNHQGRIIEAIAHCGN